LCRPALFHFNGKNEKKKKLKKKRKEEKKRKRKRKERRTFCLEGEVICQVAALVISPEQEEGRGIPHLDGVEVENHLRKWKERK